MNLNFSFNNINVIINSPIFWINLIVWICILSLVIAVFVDFLLYDEKNIIKHKLKSRVATWRMFIFFIIIYFVLKFRIWVYTIEIHQTSQIIIWIIIVIFSTFYNILWRFHLSTNWANNIKIYSDHSFITTGPYRFVRHPLYASLIWINYWVALIYSNWLVIVLASFIFLPMMFYRASQEEKLLIKNFSDYKKYKKNVWMFFPKIIKKW